MLEKTQVKTAGLVLKQKKKKQGPRSVELTIGID